MVSGEAGANVPAAVVVLKLTVSAPLGIGQVAVRVFQVDRDRVGGDPGGNGLRRSGEDKLSWPRPEPRFPAAWPTSGRWLTP